jgi:hypothetical protein
MEQLRASKAVVVLVGGIFIAYGIYALVQSRANPRLLGVLIAAVAVVGGLGLILNCPWSKYCIYLVSAALTGTWLYYTAAYVMRQGWPYSTAAQSLIALLPGLLIVVIGAGSSYVVTRHFRRG